MRPPAPRVPPPRPPAFRAYFPRFQVRAPGGVTEAMMRSARVVSWDPSAAQQAVHDVLGDFTAPSDLASRYRQAQVADPAGFTRKLVDAYRPLWEQAEQVLADLPADQAESTVISSDASPATGGHVSLVLTREPPGASPLSGIDYRVLRSVMGCFPGYFAQLDPQTASRYAEAFRGGGVSAAAQTLKGVWSALAEFNAQRFTAGSPLDGIGAIGMSSIIAMEGHTVLPVDDGRVHSIANSTGPQHAFDGLAGLVLLERADARLWASLHVGEAALPGVDAANLATAPYVFKLALSRGLTLFDHYADYVDRVGPDEAAKGFLSNLVWWTFQEDALRDGRLGQTFDAAVLATIDALGGNLLSYARRWMPNTAVVIDPATYPQLTDDQVRAEVDDQALAHGERAMEPLPPDPTPGSGGSSDGPPVPGSDPLEPGHEPGSDPVDPVDPARGPDGPDGLRAPMSTTEEGTPA